MAPEQAHAGRHGPVGLDDLQAMAREVEALRAVWRHGPFALFALAASLLIGGLLRFISTHSEQRARERLLDSRRPVATSHEVSGWGPRPARPRAVAAGETAARVLYIVARDQPELVSFLRQDFAAEEAEGVIEILVDRRQGAQRCEADGRDPRRNGSVSVDLREMGFAFVRRQAP